MKLAGVARFDCVGSTQESTCYIAGFASHGDHACSWTTSALHSHLAWQYWFRWGCGSSSTTSFIADLAGGYIPYPRCAGPDHAALHPFRRAAPVTSRCTRSEGVQCLRIGCTASSMTSLCVGLLAGAGHAGIRQAQAAQHCTRYSSNALDRRTLHYLLSSATLR